MSTPPVPAPSARGGSGDRASPIAWYLAPGRAAASQTSTLGSLSDCLITLSKEEIAALPIRRYDGEVNLVATSAAFARAREDIRAETVTGFDTETRPAFRKGESYLPCLVQVATARVVHLFQLSRLD